VVNLKLTAGHKPYASGIWYIFIDLKKKKKKKLNGAYELKCVLLVRGCFVDISIYHL
jgi:hypothetical protein